MSFLNKEELLQSQDTWERSQVRLPPTLHGALVDYSKENNLSKNAAIVELLDKALSIPNRFSQQPSPSIGIFEIYPSDYEKEDTMDARYFNNLMTRVIPRMVTKYLKANSSYNLLQIESLYSTNSNNAQILIGARIWFKYPSSE